MACDDKYEIPDTGAVFTFGRSRFAENLSSHFFIRNDCIVEISCGDEHTALVCKSGRIFLFGQNDYGQLGFGHTKPVHKPSCLKYLKPFQSNHVACGKSHTIVSTVCGRLFGFGSNSEGQLGMGDLIDRMVPQVILTGLSDEDKIVELSAGCHHSAFLTDKGKLYVWGGNSDGQCGREEMNNLLTPHQLHFVNPIDSMSCGYYHTAFTSLGDIYTFGEEDKGKLGCSRKISKNIPEKVDLQKKCILVKCGGNHTMVLTEEGHIFAFGSNFSGQLGIGVHETECIIPKIVEFPNDVKWTYFSCGESHSALITDGGFLYTCGDARHGKLCNEDESKNRFSPILIKSLQNYHCNLVSCGGCHTMVLAKPSPHNYETEFSNIIKSEHENDNGRQLNVEGQNKNNKSSSGSSLNNNNSSSLNTEIYNAETPEITTSRSDTFQSKSVNDKISLDEPKLSSDDNNSVKTENTFKKLITTFKGKKSGSIKIFNNESKKGSNEIVKTEVKVENQQKSRTCSIL